MNTTNNNENTELKCELCGKIMTKPAFTGEYKNVCHDCFNDKFWMLKIRDVNKAPEKFATIKNNLYYIADENDNDSFRGFDGRKVIIKFNVSDIIVLSIRDLAFDLIVVDWEGGFEIESCCMIGDLFIKCVILILLAYNNNCFSFLIKLAYLD